MRLQLIRRGLRVVPAATHRKTIERVIITPMQSRGGDWFVLMSTTERRRALSVEISQHLEAVSA